MKIGFFPLNDLDELLKFLTLYKLAQCVLMKADVCTYLIHKMHEHFKCQVRCFAKLAILIKFLRWRKGKR